MKPASKVVAPMVLAGLLLSLAALVGSQPAPREQVGPLAGGGFLLNSGWVVRAAGRQIPVETLPLAMALSPDGKYLLVLNCGYRPPSISVIETATQRVVGVTRVPRTGEHVLTVPLTRGPGGRCSVRFSVALSAVPARVEHGSTDSRRLGVHFLGFRYLLP